jgi:hypothetical protein
VCFFGENFAKFQSEKYDLHLYKGFTQGKNGPNLPDFEGKKKCNLPDLYDKFQQTLHHCC